jgi:hypothetical protein
MLTCGHSNGCDLSRGYGVAVQRDDTQDVAANTDADGASLASTNVSHTKSVPLAWNHCKGGQRRARLLRSV